MIFNLKKASKKSTPAKDFIDFISKIWNDPNLENLIDQTKKSKEKLQISKYQNIKIFFVNGNYIKEKDYMDFVEGGHDLVYDKFIPKNQIWIDANLDVNSIPYVLLHEMIERNIMDKQKIDYEKAHDQANIIERKFRKMKIFEKQRKMIDFPRIKQPDDKTCGHTCLNMILQYYNINSNVQEIIDKTNLIEKKDNTEGLAPQTIKKLAESFNLNASIKNISTDDIKEAINKNIPLIIELQAWADKDNKVNYSKTYDHGHYVVAIGYTESHIVFADPSSFFKTFLPINELKKRWHDIDHNKKMKNVAIYIKNKEKTNDFNTENTIKMGNKYNWFHMANNKTYADYAD